MVTYPQHPQDELKLVQIQECIVFVFLQCYQVTLAYKRWLRNIYHLRLPCG